MIENKNIITYNWYGIRSLFPTIRENFFLTKALLYTTGQYVNVRQCTVRRIATVSVSNRQRSVKKCKKLHCVLAQLSQSLPRVYVSSAWILGHYILIHRQDTNQQQNQRSDAIVNLYVKMSFTAKTNDRSEDKHFWQNFSIFRTWLCIFFWSVNLKNWNKCNMSESRVIEFFCGLGNDGSILYIRRWHQFVSAALLRIGPTGLWTVGRWGSYALAHGRSEGSELMLCTGRLKCKLYYPKHYKIFC